MGTPFHVELVTPERVLFAGEVDEVSMRTVEGEITFLARHEDYIGVAAVTVVRMRVIGGDGAGRVEDEPAEMRAAVHGGFVHVSGEGVVILAGVAELASEIDVARARAALAAAEARLAGSPAPIANEGQVPGTAGVPDHPGAGGAPGTGADDSVRAAIGRARVRLEAAGVTVPT